MAPKGNKFAAGCTTSGRPRIYELDVMANKLLKWADSDDAISLNGFAAQERIPQEYISVWAKESYEFSQALKITRSILASRRERKVNNEEMNYGLFMRTQGMFDTLLHEYEDSNKVRDAEIKAKADSKNANPSQVTILDYSKVKE